MSYPYLSDLLKALTGLDWHFPFSSIATFGLMVAVAMIVAGNYLKRELQRQHEAGKIGCASVRTKGEQKGGQKGGQGMELVPPQDIVSDFTIIVMMAGIFGARLFHILEHLDQFVLDPWGMIFTRSGLSIFGGLIMGALAGVLCVRRWKLPMLPLMDATAPALMLGYAIGRIGCQLSGDGDWGIASDMLLKPDWLPTWFWAQTYQNNIVGILIPAPGVYPAPIYETLMSLLCFGVLRALRGHPFQFGWLFSVYLVLVGIERLIIEQIRTNPVLSVLGIHATQAQMIAVVMIVLGVLGIAVLTRRVAAPG